METNPPKETAVFFCSHVFENFNPVNLVVRAEGELQMLCGQNHPADEIPRVIGLGHLLERDSSLVEAVNIPDGWEAERDQFGKGWRKKPS